MLQLYFFLRFHPSVNPNDKADDIARFSKNSSGSTNMIPLKRYYSFPYTSFTSPIHRLPEPYLTNIA